jgi:hypothetical protein
MSTVHEEINRALADCHMRTGGKATRVYLGKTQVFRLMKWAQESGYIADAATAKRDGEHRPEVMGLPIYEVNDEDHCVAV